MHRPGDPLPLTMRLVFSLFLMAAVATVTAQETFVQEFEVAGLSCDACAASAKDALVKVRGVKSAEVTYATKKARVVSTRPIDDQEIRATLGKLGFEARFANDPATPALTPAERARLDIAIASRGEAFDVRKHLARGKYTIFDFWAEWCGPCHVLTPKIEQLVKSRPDVALRTIDLKNWDSDAAKQATEEFKLPGLPYVRVYGPDGRFLGAVVGNDIDKIRRLVERK